MLTFVVCFLGFVIVSAIPVDRDEVVYPSIETLRDGMKSVTVRAFGQDINLKLQPAGKHISKDFSVVDGAGNEILDSEFQLESFKRKLYRDKRMGSSLYIDDEDGPLYIYGVINSKLRIEPQDAIKNNKRAHLVVEIKNKNKNARFKDKVVPAGIMRNANRKDVQIPIDHYCVNIECTVIAGSTFTESFPRSNGVTLEQNLAVSFLGVQDRMDTLDLDIKISLYGIVKITRETEPKLAPYINESIIPNHDDCLDTKEMLDKMRDFYSRVKLRKIVNCDIAMLIVRQNLCDVGEESIDPLSGLAYTGGVCEEEWKFGISMDEDDDFESKDTIAHECAHLLGAPHDGNGPVEGIENSPGSKNCSNSGLIMDAEGNKTKSYRFSSCTMENVKNMLTLDQSSCIKDECYDEYDY